MLELINVEKNYGRKKVLKGVSFVAKKGEITALIGINGTGKTTILKAIMNLHPISKGQILLDGKPMDQSRYLKLAFIPDSPLAPKNQTIQEAMAFMATFYNNWNQAKANQLLHFFRLNADDRIGTLSKGNQAKVNLVLGLALDVDFVLMDEPFSGIDIFSREQITSVFTTSLVEGKGVIVTTHEIDDIEYLVDQAVLLEDGRVIKTFYPEEVREEEGKSIVDVMREVYLP